MKRYIRTVTGHSENYDAVFGMSNLVPSKTGLPIYLWSDHRGINSNVSHNLPRIKVGNDEYQASASISPNPQFLTDTSMIPANVVRRMKQAFPYISRNYDLFLKHYFDVTDEFLDEDLQVALRERGDYN